MIHLSQTKFFGPSWQGDAPVIEYLFVLEAEEFRLLREYGETYRDQLLEALRDAGIEEGDLKLLRRKLPVRARKRFAFLLSATALMLQRHSGHRVFRASSVAPRGLRWTRAAFEHEDCQTGVVAGDLAIEIINRTTPLHYPLERKFDASMPTADLIERFRKRFAKRALPEETRMIIAAANRAGVPWMKLDREPFNGFPGRRRFRRNGALILGQGRHQKLLDGSFHLNLARRSSPLVHDRVAAARKLVQLGIPQSGPDGPLRGHTVLEAVRATERIGFPVIVKPRRRTGDAGVSGKITSIAALLQAVNDAQQISKEFVVERFVRGTLIRLLVVDQKLVAAFDARGSRAVQELDESMADLCRRVADGVKSKLLQITVVSPRFDEPLEQSGGAVVDLEFAPDFAQLLPARSMLRREVMDAFMRSLFPAGTPSSIPIVAVMGAAGTESTSRKTAHLLSATGLLTGLCCSDELYVNGDAVAGKRGQKFKRRQRYRALVEDVEAAVIEFRFAFIRRHGFPFQNCSVVVFGHLGLGGSRPGWETDDMVIGAYRKVLKRARAGVVFNADDPLQSSLMAGLSEPGAAVVSVKLSHDELAQAMPGAAVFVVLERIAGQDRLVVYEPQGRVDLLALSEIADIEENAPIIDATAWAQVIATARLLGIENESVRELLVARGKGSG